MDLYQGLILITSIHLLAAASPGPDFVLVSQQTLTQGRRTGLLCSLGISLGLSVHIIYSAFGLAAIIANSEMALWLIKICGGGYLFYLGYKGIRAQPSIEVDQEPDPINNIIVGKPSSIKSISTGFLCNALNPKAPIYFVSLFTIVLSAEMPLYHIAIYGVWMMLIQLAWFSTVVLLLSQPRINRKFKQLGHLIDRIFGIALLALGLKVLFTKI